MSRKKLDDMYVAMIEMDRKDLVRRWAEAMKFLEGKHAMRCLLGKAAEEVPSRSEESMISLV